MSDKTTEPVTLVTYAHPDRPAVRISQPAYVSVPLWAIDIRFETRTAPSPQTTEPVAAGDFASECWPLVNDYCSKAMSLLTAIKANGDIDGATARRDAASDALRAKLNAAPSPRTTLTEDEIMRLADDSVGCYWPSGRAALTAAVGRLVAENERLRSTFDARVGMLEEHYKERLEKAEAERDVARKQRDIAEGRVDTLLERLAKAEADTFELRMLLSRLEFELMRRADEAASEGGAA